jgi:anti-sigma B factor antagonist
LITGSGRIAWKPEMSFDATASEIFARTIRQSGGRRVSDLREFIQFSHACNPLTTHRAYDFVQAALGVCTHGGTVRPSRPKKGTQLKLSLRIRRTSEAVIVRCEGRIVYRQEATALTRLVTQALHDVNLAVLDLSGVEAIDSAGMGELVLLHMYAEGHGKTVSLAAVPERLLELLDLTNLTSVFPVHASLERALEEHRPAISA